MDGRAPCLTSCLTSALFNALFNIQRGVRQGCSLSPYLLVLSVEMLAKEIRKTRNINGILVNDEEIKLSQYADDTTLILDGPRESLMACIQTLDDFHKVSRLKLNDQKVNPLDRIQMWV